MGTLRVLSSGWSSVTAALASHSGGELGGLEELRKESLRSIKSPNLSAWARVMAHTGNRGNKSGSAGSEAHIHSCFFNYLRWGENFPRIRSTGNWQHVAIWNFPERNFKSNWTKYKIVTQTDYNTSFPMPTHLTHSKTAQRREGCWLRDSDAYATGTILFCFLERKTAVSRCFKKAPFLPLTNPGAAIRWIEPISRSDLLSITHTLREDCSHTSRRMDISASNIHQIMIQGHGNTHRCRGRMLQQNGGHA